MSDNKTRAAVPLTLPRMVALAVRDTVEARDAITAALHELDRAETIAQLQCAHAAIMHAYAALARAIQARQFAEMMA